MPSEVTQLMRQIAEETRAMQQGLTGLAETAKHSFIHARYSAIEQLRDKLSGHLGDDNATKVMSAIMDKELQ